MGLDMFIYSTNKKAKVSDLEVHDGDYRVKEIAYWRKNYPLNDFFEEIFKEKGGKEGDFNCSTTVLKKKDIKRALELPFLTDMDRAILRDVLEEKKEGKLVYYVPWW